MCVWGDGMRMSEVRCGRKFQSGDLLDVSGCLSRCGAGGQRLREDVQRKWEVHATWMWNCVVAELN